jgi:MoxR-like ATPase
VPAAFIPYEKDLLVRLPRHGGIGDQVHLFDLRQARAINAALAAGRPLLVRGEPGTGKSQLARAAAQVLGRAYIQYVVDSQTESRDLLWQVDALARLGEAQLIGALRDKSAEQARGQLAIERFLHPGPLWWAFDWEDADRQAQTSQSPNPLGADAPAASNGCVVLVDEIDKAESEVPNGLLEALGAGEFAPPGRHGKPVLAREPLPLVFITTNEERALPDAFLRRCLVLRLELPKDEGELAALLQQRGAAHFPHAQTNLLRKAAVLLVEDRKAAKEAQARPLPGQAEYLDLLRAVLTEFGGDLQAQMEALDKNAEYTLRKHDR